MNELGNNPAVLDGSLTLQRSHERSWAKTTKLNYSWVSGPQKLCNNKYLSFKVLSLEQQYVTHTKGMVDTVSFPSGYITDVT